MPSVELSKLQGIGPVRALSDSDRTQAAARAAPLPAAVSAKPGVAVEIGAASEVDLASPPVDPERVAKIRNALRDGTYPLVPTKIADAMIAAQVSFAVLPAGER
ncbi:MAG: flagellar biosynthesis anti-sigma factor FlgM [Erythrobacter sp.]